ncbi:MAG: hypothetical protein KatS3mg110_1899 [Pirellulaceae bacterium]|nr:MAG: hypothetical protein KatS3mg110_1899 [Pirellulaceae bacterium]
MPFRYACPHCGIETLVDDRYEGQSGPCAGCGLTVVIERPRPVRQLPTQRKNARQDVSVGTIRIMIGVLLLAAAVGSLATWIIYANLLPRWRAWQQARQAVHCQQQLKKIAIALRNYYADYGQLPPVVVKAADGTPMHSWRVLLLPYLGYEALWANYRLDQPWNSPANQAVAMTIPAEYQDTSQLGSNTTPFLAITGPNAAWTIAETRQSAKFAEPAQQIILVMEMAGSNILWTQPVDADLSKISFTINGKHPIGPRAGHSGGPHVMAMDGSVYQLRPDLPDHMVRSLLDATDGATLSMGTVVQPP